MDLGTIAIVIAVVFLIYRFGFVKLAQTNIERVNTIADSSMELMELELEERRTRRLGKIEAKIDDSSIKRATANTVRNKLRTIGATAA